MQIKSLKLKNYRQYKGPISIKFADIKSGKNFTIIQGPNGSGKSNILNAITWCLYGKEIHLKNEGKTLPLINTNAFEDLDLNDIAEVEVEIEMLDDKDNKYIFTRRMGFKKDKDEIQLHQVPLYSSTTKPQRDGSIFEIQYQEGKEMQNAYIPDYFVERFRSSFSYELKSFL